MSDAPTPLADRLTEWTRTFPDSEPLDDIIADIRTAEQHLAWFRGAYRHEATRRIMR